MRKIIIIFLIVIGLIGGILNSHIDRMILQGVSPSIEYRNFNECAQGFLWCLFATLIGVPLAFAPKKTIDWFFLPVSSKVEINPKKFDVLGLHFLGIVLLIMLVLSLMSLNTVCGEVFKLAF